jgi:hypothetical protein
MLFRQRIQAITHVVELLGFLKKKIWVHWNTRLSKRLRRENFRWADLAQGT